ncbi:MAG: autotransporter outer membrane beta-barrel domain-containing protein [Verrucomicrobiales bacterium]|nr:autotransporter outer membrane beta-barrel domain-containing protein [Verrucomicrobiales bacterium]
MKTRKLTLILTLLCALSTSALNVLAENKVVTTGTVTESDKIYESVATQAALQVSNSQTLYSGTNLILSATFDTGNGRFGAYANQHSRIEIYGGTITTTGSTGYGAYINNAATGLLSQVDINTSGHGAHGILVGHYATVVELRDVSITTSGSSADGIHGLFMNTPAVRFNNLTIVTHGDGSAGFATEGSSPIQGTAFSGTGLRITTYGNGYESSGIKTYCGLLDVTDFVIQTHGDGAIGVERGNSRGGLIYLTSGTIETSGSGAIGLDVGGYGGGETVLTDVVIRTTGSNATGVTVTSTHTFGEDYGPTVFKGGSVTAEQGNAVVMSGYKNPALTFQDGAVVTGDVVIRDSGTTPDGNYDYGYTLNLTDSTLNGDITNHSSGTGGLTVNLDHSSLTGDAANLGDGVLVITLDNNSIGTGGYNGGNLITGGDSTWTFTKDSHGNYGKNDGVWNIGDYEVIFDNMIHTGTVNLSVNSDTGEGGSITVTDTADGDGTVHIDTTGNGKADPNQVLPGIVSGDGTEHWQWDPIDWGIDTIIKDGDHFIKSGVSPAGAVLNSAIAVQQAMWFAQQNSLLKRLGELRYGARASRPQAGGTPALHIIENIWLRSYGQQLNVGSQVAGKAYEQLIYGVDLGTDHKFTISADSDLYLGVYAGYGRSDLDYRTPGTDGELNSYYGGLYATWLHSSGFYIDATFKAASVNNDLKAPYGNTQLTANYSDVNIGGSIEIGKKFTFADDWFIEPQLQVNYLHILAEDYTAGPMTISAQDLDALQLRIGSVFGRTIKLTNSGALQPYVKISGVETISSGGTLRNGYQHTRANTDGARAELGGGLIWQLDANNQLHLDYEASFGDKYDKPWGLTAGYRHQF